MAMEVARLAREGKLIWKAPLPKSDEEKKALGDKFVFAADGTHPHPETGHELYLQAIVRSLEPIKAASKDSAPHTLPAPFIATNYENAKLLPISEATLSKGIVFIDPAKDDFGKPWANRLPQLYRGTEPGEMITFKFKGTRAAIYDVVGPSSGQVIITLDQQPPRVVPRFDAYCTYRRLSTFMIGTELADEVHTVKIEISAEEPDKVNILSQRKQTMDNPARFKGREFYPGAILLVGEIVK
jgi:hypothetical protein